jgi:transcription elongation factor GreA
MALPLIPPRRWVKAQHFWQEELLKLRSIDRPVYHSGQLLRHARGSDLSENAEYEAAKERQSFIEGRINGVEAKVIHTR